MHGGFDEEEEDHNAIIDCDILEAAKENIQPLACGRRVTALASVLKTPHQLRDAKLKATRARLREFVREAQERVDKIKLRASKAKAEEAEELNKGDGEDKGNRSDGEREEEDEDDEEDEEELTLTQAEESLLEEYVRLVNWTIEHYPRGQSAQSGILELLEEATRALRHSEFAKTDARYLNLWLRYATYIYNPEVIYEFILANEIGIQWAKLYEEYASFLEKINRRPKADATYLMGIERKAEPLDRLERRHREFQKRMMVAAPVADADVLETAATPASNTIPQRQPLAESSSTSTTHSIRTPLATTSSTFDVFSADPSSSSIASQDSSSQARPRVNGRIPVFIDPTGEASRAQDVRNKWPELGTRAERIKENRMKPEKMQGTILKQKGAAKEALREAAARARAAPKFVPYRDPEPETSAPAPSVSGKKFEVFKGPEPPSLSSESGNPSSAANEKFEVYRDPEPPVVGTSSNRKFEVFRDPETSVSPSKASKPFKVYEDPVPLAPPTSSGRSFEVYVDPAPTAGNTGPAKDTEAPVTRASSRKSKTVPLNNVAPTPRRSARLNPQLAAKEDVRPEPILEEEDKDAEADTPAKTSGDAGQGPGKAASVRLTVLRPKALGLSAGEASSEAEALRRNPFKNYKDL